MSPLIFVIIIIILAWSFDFLNGANDRANAIATTVATKALSPLRALILASVFNLAGAFITTRVAETIGKGIVPKEFLNFEILIAAMGGAIVWVFFCTRFGIPISVTHALIGGLMGAGIAFGGCKILAWGIIFKKIILAIFLGPLVGFLAGALVLVAIFWFFRKKSYPWVNWIFRKGQIISASLMALAHGMNDTQNAMGIITAALLSGGFISEFSVPFWVKLSCGFFMGLGTFVMGWKVMKTLGWKVARLQPVHGFSAETGAALVVGIKSLFGMPVSTTQVVSGAVMGGAAVQRLKKVRWVVARKIIITWILTIPGAALISGLVYWFLSII